MGNAIKQSIGDGLHKLATGQERQHLDDQGRNTGHIKVGDKIPVNENDPTKGTRTATANDVAKQAGKLGRSSADKAVQKAVDSNKSKTGTEQTEEYEKKTKTGQHLPKAQSEM